MIKKIKQNSKGGQVEEMQKIENTKRDSLASMIDGAAFKANERRGGVVKYYRSSFESAGISTEKLNECEAEILSQQVGLALSELDNNIVRL